VNEGIEPELLFDVAALLITSAALGPAAEASVAPASFSISRVVDTTTLPGALETGGTIIPLSLFEIAPHSPAQVRAVTGIAQVRELAALSSTQIESLIASDPSLVTKLLASPPSARDVSDLWSSMDASSRARLTSSAPRLVGNLDGFPTAVRNQANRAWVKHSIAELTRGLTGVDGRVVAESSQQQLHMLGRVEAALKTPKGKAAPPRSLFSVDDSGSGKAVIVIGDLQTADYVTYMIPGMFYTVDGQLGAWTGDAADLYSQQVRWLHRLSKADPADANKTVAVVAWMGYQTPDLTNIGSLDLANQGRDELARDIQALQLQRGEHQPYTTIVGHSYGSTAALMALTEYDFTVDALALVGTPGSAAQSSHDLHVRGNNVWVGSAAWDPVPSSAWFGSDPAAPSYGAHTMGVGGATDVITGASLSQSIGHNEYFDPGTESIRNLALIGIGHSELVMRGVPSDRARTLSAAR
jgi:hypothetical protein